MFTLQAILWYKKISPKGGEKMSATAVTEMTLREAAKQIQTEASKLLRAKLQQTSTGIDSAVIEFDEGGARVIIHRAGKKKFDELIPSSLDMNPAQLAEAGYWRYWEHRGSRGRRL